MPRSNTTKRVVQRSVPAKQEHTNWFQRMVANSYFGILYAIVSVLVLFGTVIFWSLLGANIQLSNADQLVSSYLFKSSAVLKGATFPGQHVFLIKWPLFLLIKMLNFSGGSIVAITVGLVITTVLALVVIIFCINRRPLVFGTICLALASALILVPAQPYAGGILPVNMAMLTTRNIEYIFYVLSLLCFAKAGRLRSRFFLLGIILSSLLIASDKLFLSVSIGAAAFALVFYAVFKRWNMVSVSVNWLIGEVLSAIIGSLILLIISASHITHISSQSSAGPYGLVNTAHNLVIGCVYAVAGLFTNLGANPGFDGTTFRNLYHNSIHRIFGVGGFAFVLNAIVFLVGIYIMIKLVRISLAVSRSRKDQTDNPIKLSIMLIWTTLATLVVFVISNHYYAVDSRYLTIVLFTVFIALATYSRRLKMAEENLVLVGLLLLIAIVLGLPTAAHINSDERDALSIVNSRNAKIVNILSIHQTDVLLGDYWRVIPTNFQSGSNLNVIPLGGCTQELTALSSTQWQTNLNNHSFAYLLSYNQDLTNYPHCTLKQVIAEYGRPDASGLIAGTITNPQEQVLFYDRGIGSKIPLTPQLIDKPATVVPATFDELPADYTSCTTPTLMSFVAHQDDDILFMNPDIYHAIKSGYCVRTVYLTAGDDGQGQFYWLSRQLGSQAAYASMLGVKDLWVSRIINLGDNHFATIDTPKDNDKVSLIFLNLPDGNLKGQGFPNTKFESLAKLLAKNINTLNTVDGESIYTEPQIIDTLSNLMITYSPTEIFTQSTYPGTTYQDHSDHNAVGKIVTQARAEYEKDQFNNLVSIPIHYYEGYPIHGLPANVSGADLNVKEAAFFAYAQHDSGACTSNADCNAKQSAYRFYLTREYQRPD